MSQIVFKPGKNRQAKTRTKTLSISLATVIILALVLVQAWKVQLSAVSPQDLTAVDIVIPEKSSAMDVGRILKQGGLIRSENVFRFYCSENDLASALKPGHYRFYRSQTLSEMAGLIAEGKVVSITVTIPEGFTADQIGRLLIEKNAVTASAWQAALKQDYNYAFLPTVGSKREQRLEGFLFPDTYIIEENTGAEQIVDMMLARFQKTWDGEISAIAQQQKKTPLQLVTIASLIEREARAATEREIISGVIKNRLDRGMALQLCSTVLYALKQEKEVLSIADTKIDSPYNTYKYPGLPPGPIASPGEASLKAALNPQQHNYLYFVAKGDGTHHFSTTLEEHNAAMKKYIK